MTRQLRSATIVATLLLSTAGSVYGQHSDVAVFQDATGTLSTHQGATGFPLARTFVRAFDFFGHLFGDPAQPKVFAGDDPGFLFSGADAPAGFSALPANTQLSLNLLPFQLPDGGDFGNLFHWDGVTGEIDFGVPPGSHSLTVTEAGGAQSYELTGAHAQFNDVVVGVTDDTGGMHEHLQYRLDDNDNNSHTDPATGFYLFGFALTMGGLEDSLPVLVALSSPEIPPTVEDDVQVWLQTHLDQFRFDPPSGDFDGNGVYDSSDIDQLVAAIASGTHNPGFDLNGDGLVDLADRDAWLAEAGAANLPSGHSFLLGDANLDGSVDVSDFNLWNGSKFTAVAAWSAGDFSADGSVDVSDFNLWNGHKFQTADGMPRLVPEPAAGIVVLITLPLCLVGRKRRGAR